MKWIIIGVMKAVACYSMGMELMIQEIPFMWCLLDGWDFGFSFCSEHWINFKDWTQTVSIWLVKSESM